MNKWGVHVIRFALAISTLAAVLLASGAGEKWF
jgi:hypothetical protein